MKTRSLLLGSLALAGLSTAGYAADLGVVTSLDVCDELGISGLTISSDNNCLVISGGVAFSYSFGQYEDDRYTYVQANGNAFVATWPGVPPAYPGIIYNAGDNLDSDVDVDAWLKFVATADSDFGPATATIKLISENNKGTVDGSVGVDEAWVGVGDTTVLMAGYKSSIFNSGDDAVLSGYPGFLGLFYAPLTGAPPSPGSGPPDGGVGRWQAASPTGAGDVNLGGAVLQVTSNLGNGIAVAGGLEGLGVSSGQPTAVGVLSYAGEGFTAHVSGAANVSTGNWITHAGFTGVWDPLTVVGAIAADSTGYYNALGSAAVTIDMFRLAASVEYVNYVGYVDPTDPPPLQYATNIDAEMFGAGGSITAMVSPGVSLNLAGKYFSDLTSAERVFQIEGQVSVAVSQQLAINGAVGYVDSTFDDVLPTTPSPAIPDHDGTLAPIWYARGQAMWTPGGGFNAGVVGTVTSQGAWQVQTMASKVIN